MSSSSLAISLALRYIEDAQKIIARTIEQLKDPKLQEHLIELTIAQNHIATVANHVNTLKCHISELEKVECTYDKCLELTDPPIPVGPRENGNRANGESRPPPRDNSSSGWSVSDSPWSSDGREQDDRIRGLTNQVSTLERELRETTYDKDNLISVKMEELALLQERLDGRDLLLSQREAELDDLRSRMHQNARHAFPIKQESLDDSGNKLYDAKDQELSRRAEEIEEPRKRLREVSSERNSRAPGQSQSHELPVGLAIQSEFPILNQPNQPQFVPQDFLNSNYPANVIVNGDEFSLVLSTERNLTIPRDIGLAHDGVWRHYHDEVSWSYGNTRFDRCVVIAPNIVYSRDKQRYEKEFRHHRLGQTKDLFWRRELRGLREWFYLGRYQCIAAVTMKTEDARFVNKQAPKALAKRTNEECMIIKNLYEIDALKCRCVALERVGFNPELQAAFLRHLSFGAKRRESFDRDDREDWKRRR